MDYGAVQAIERTMAVTLDLNKLGVVAGQLCRVCARLSQRLTPIFGQKGIEIDLATKIHTHLPIMVTEDDLMPVCLCEPCIHKLQVCHNLVNTCLEGDIRLRKIMGLPIEQEVIPEPDCELIDLEKEEPSEKAATLEDKNQETEHKQEESDDDFVWEENQSAVDVIPPSPPPDEIRPQRVAKRGRPRKFPVPQEIKQVIKNQRYKIVVVKMKSKRPLTQEEIIKMLKARDPNNDLFKSGATNILQKVDVQPGNQFTQGKEDSEQVLMDLTDEPTNQSATSLDHSSIAYYQDTNKKQSLNSEDKFKCVYCNIALVGTESLLAHHSSIHPDKVFICNQCTPPLVFYESKHAFDLHTLNHLEAEEGEIRTCMSEDANNIGELANEHIDQSNTSSKKHQALESQNRFTRTDLEPAPKDVFSYLCSYCKETLIGTDMFLAHQSQMHPDKVFTCTICKPHVVFYETKELFERHMLCHPQEIIERDDSLEESVITALDKPATEDYAETLPTGTTDENVSVSTPDDASVLITASNEVAGTSACPIDVSTLIKDDSENNFSFVDAPIPYQENPVDTFTFSNAEIPAINSVTDVTTSDPSHKQPDNLEITTIFNVQVETPNILTGISEHQINSNLRMKLSKEFQGVSKSLQSRIIETIQKIASTKKSNQSRLALKRPYNLKVKKTIMKRKRLRSKFGWYCRQCDLKFDSSEELETHKSANTCSTHPCQYCGKLFHSKKILLEHERLHTNERPYMCEYCGKSFRTCTMLRTHHNSHSTNQTFVCPDCGKSYNNKASFHYHAATHNSQEFLCDICGKKLKHAGSLRIHKLKHSNPDAFKRVSCDICGNLYESRYRMMEHRRLHTNERPYKCAEPDCFKMFRKLEQLRQHSTVHTNLRKFKCDVCEKSFKRRSNLKTHRKIHCQDYRYKCSVCLLPYNSLRELLSHRSLHTQEELKQANKEPFECPECKKILSTKVSLQQHLLTHTNLAPFGCNFCQRSFRSKVSRDVHLRTHTGEKPYACKYCEANFSLNASLVVHERIHTGEKPFPCNMCDKAFRSKINLMQHSIVHSELRPYVCSVCNRAFRRRDGLETHMRVHTNERPYACKWCDRAFKQKGDCNKHMNTHFKTTTVPVAEDTSSSAYTCPFCKKKIKSSAHIKMHFSVVHGITSLSSSSPPDNDTMVMINTDDFSSVSEVEITMDPTYYVKQE